MHWRNEKEWQKWEDRLIDGETYSFAHLRSFDMEIVKEARGDLPEYRATVRVVFDCHVVSEKAEYIPDDQAYWLDTGGHGRKFELRRYRYSKQLPTMINGLPMGQVKCYVGKHNNYMVWEAGEGAGHAHYQAYFDIYKPHQQPAGEVPLLILYVQSAYLKDEPLAVQRERSKAFGQICAELTGAVQRKTKGPFNKAKRKKR